MNSRSIQSLSYVVQRLGPLCAAVALIVASLLRAEPALAQKDLTVKLPAAGDYLVWAEAHSTSGAQAQAPVRVTSDRAALSLPAPPAGLREWLVLVYDEKTGYVAAKNLPTKETPAAVSFTTPDFNRVHRVRVQVTGAGDKPVANASVMLTDSSGLSLSKVIDPTAAGIAEFTDIPSGSAKLAVTISGGKSTTKDVDINLPKGETIQSITIPLPEVTTIVEPPAAATGAAATSTPAPEKNAGGKAGTDTGTAATKTDAAEKGAATEAPSGGGGMLQSLIGVILVLGVGYWFFLHAKNQGWTLDKALARLGVQPVAPVPAGAGAATPAPPPPPVDPNVCAFCGQRKDPVSGVCACSLDAASLGGGAFSAPPAGGGSGPRLVAVGGMAMGQIFPLSGEASIGRDPGNAVSLAMDSTVSRRHAVITPDESGYMIRDQGSSNGTFVNGARVTESPLRPGDELSIGGTRFRFEA